MTEQTFEWRQNIYVFHMASYDESSPKAVYKSVE